MHFNYSKWYGLTYPLLYYQEICYKEFVIRTFDCIMKYVSNYFKMVLYIAIVIIETRDKMHWWEEQRHICRHIL